MKKAILDLTNCKSYMEMHRRFKKDLIFPDFYGENWDAFWDSLMYESPLNYVEVRGEHTVGEELAPMLEKLHEMLERVKQMRRKYGLEFDYVIVD